MSIQFSPKVENCLRLRSLAYANLILGTVSVTFQVIFKYANYSFSWNVKYASTAHFADRFQKWLLETLSSRRLDRFVILLHGICFIRSTSSTNKQVNPILLWRDTPVGGCLNDVGLTCFYCSWPYVVQLMDWPWWLLHPLPFTPGTGSRGTGF